MINRSKSVLTDCVLERIILLRTWRSRGRTEARGTVLLTERARRSQTQASSRSRASMGRVWVRWRGRGRPPSTSCPAWAGRTRSTCCRAAPSPPPPSTLSRGRPCSAPARKWSSTRMAWLRFLAKDGKRSVPVPIWQFINIVQKGGGGGVVVVVVKPM